MGCSVVPFKPPLRQIFSLAATCLLVAACAQSPTRNARVAPPTDTPHPTQTQLAATPNTSTEAVAIQDSTSKTALTASVNIDPKSSSKPSDNLVLAKLDTSISSLPATDTTPDEIDLWQRIRDGYSMPELDSSQVASNEKWYANHPDYFARMIDRAQLYLYYIVEEVEKRGMPTEIALLPMVESAFNPDATSVSSAAGIWQFIPSTGKNFGLEQNWWHDERRDIISATNSALDYLQNLHDEFGDWELALAAYNCGEHNVERAIAYNRKHHRATDYSHLRLPRETRGYVPKLIAVKHIVSNPEKFGLALNDIANHPYFEAVTPPRHMDVKVAAELAGMSIDDFTALNPEYHRPVILQNEDAPILLPVDKVGTFLSNVDTYDKPFVSWQPYQSKKGEHFDKLAKQFGISLRELLAANGLPIYSKTSSGQKLLVSADNTDENDDGDFKAFNTHMPPTLVDMHATVHVVRRGETLGGIANHYHISLASLKRQNHGRTMIHPGQRLVVAAGAGGSYFNPSVHVVRPGETLSSISRLYKIDVDILKRQNHGSTLIHPGQKFVIDSSVSVALNR